MGGDDRPLGAPTSPEASGEGPPRYVTLRARARCTGRRKAAPNPSPARIYDAWGALGFERGALGLPTSAEIPEPQWIVQNFQHGTLNFDRENGTGDPGHRRGAARTAAVVGRPPPGPARAVHPIAPDQTPAATGSEPPPLEHPGHAVVGVGGGHLVGGRHRVGMRVAHRHPETGPAQHRHVVGHVAEGDHVARRRSPAGGPPPRCRWPC